MSIQVSRRSRLPNEPSDAPIDRASPVPYYQLAEMFQQEIASGRWQAGFRLPSEPELCEQYGLSQTTVRQALARLQRRGLIERLKGQGTFVQRGQPGLGLLQSSADFFQDEVDRLGRTVTSQIVRAERGPMPAWECHALELPPRSDGKTLKPLRSVGGLVGVYVVNHLTASVADAALASANANESLYRRVRVLTGLVPHCGRRALEATAAVPRLPELLELPRGAPVVCIESVAWDAEMHPFDCYRAWLHTDRTRIDLPGGRSSRRSDAAVLRPQRGRDVSPLGAARWADVTGAASDVDCAPDPMHGPRPARRGRRGHRLPRVPTGRLHDRRRVDRRRWDDPV